MLLRPHSVVVADELEVSGSGTYNRKQVNLLYHTVKRLLMNSAVWEVQPFLLSTTPQKYTFDRRRKDFSGHMARLTSRDQPTVSHRGSSRMRGVRWHLVRRDKSPHLPWDLNARTILQHCTLEASILAIETVKCIYIKVPAFIYNISV